ncbi:MAG: hypothetical protein AAGF01_19845 [Cyanobacteria bacterium P01_G01_bin.38]
MTAPSNFEASDYQHEPGSPFINETVFTDDAAQAFQSQALHRTELKPASPFLDAFEPKPKEVFEAELAEEVNFLAEEKEEFYTEFSEDEATESVEFESESNVESEFSESDKKQLELLFKDSQKIFSDSELRFRRDIDWIRGVISLVDENSNGVIKHLRYTRDLFECPKDNTVKVDEIDWPLVIIIAGREAADKNILTQTSRPNKPVITAGRDTHPDGVAGFDYLYNFLNLFPDEIRRTVHPVKKGFKEGREDRKPACIPKKYLLAGAIVNIVHSERIFEKEVRKHFEENADKLLSDLSIDARRYWVAISFGRSGWMRTFVRRYKTKFDQKKITGLNAILEDERIRRIKKGKDGKPLPNPVRRAYRAAIQARILERYKLPKDIKDFLSGRDRKIPFCGKLPADYDCVRPPLRNYEFIESEIQSCAILPISNTPKPCRFYTIKYKVDSKGLIDLAGRAYDVTNNRLKLAQWINNHPYNQRFRLKSNASKSFPKGRISFNPRFARDVMQQANSTGLAPRGNAFATIFIPPPPNWLGKTFSSCTRLEAESEIEQEDAISEFWPIDEALEPELAWEQPYRFEIEEHDESPFGVGFLEELDVEKVDSAESSEIEDDFDGETWREDEWEDEVSENETWREDEWEDEALESEFISDEFAESETLDDEFLDDETLDDEFLDDEFSDNNFLDNETSDDEFLDDEVLEAEFEFEAFDDESVLFDQEVTVATRPTPGRFYQIRSGDNLLKIAGIAYRVGSGARRLAFAKYINGHPLNHRYYVKSQKTFIKQHFPEGIISFFPKFSCDVDTLLKSSKKLPSGKCFAVIWIPHDRASHHSFLGKGRKRALVETEVEDELSKHQTRTRIKIPSHLIKEIPYRWTCLLELTYKDPDDAQALLHFIGTGFLIDNNHILTAAHNLFTVIQGSKRTPKPMQVSSITIAPGANGWQSKDYLFGVYEIKNADDHIAAPNQWLRRNRRFQSLAIPSSRKKTFHIAPDKETSRFDYGLIKLDKDIGASLFKKISNEPLGHWGDRETSKIKSFNPRTSIKGDVHICGYDRWLVGRRQGFIQFKASTGVTSIDVGSRDLIEYSEHNTESGMSGGPIWIERQGHQRLIGVHGHRGYGLLLTSEVLRDIEQLKRQLG